MTSIAVPRAASPCDGTTVPALSRETPEREPGADRLGRVALAVLALCVGLGDIAQVSPGTTLVLNAVHVLPLAVVALALLGAIRARRWPRYPPALALPLAVWLAVLVAAAALAPSRSLDALASLERPATGALLAWAVTHLCTSRRHWRLLLQALATGTLLVAAVGLAEATGAPSMQAALSAIHDGEIPIGDVPRVAATLSHPNEAAMLLELGLPLLVAWAWAASPRWKPALLVACLATTLAIVLTFSRAGVGVAVLALGCMAALAWRHGQDTRRRLLLLACVATIVPLALGWTALVDPGLDRRLLAGLDESSPIQPPRTEFWSIALQMGREHSLLGVGPDNFRWLFAGYTGVQADNLGIHAHNQYLEALADTGVLGLIALAWALGALLVRSVRAAQRAGPDWPWRAAVLASLSSWLLHALVDDFERFWPTSVAFWLLAGLSLSRLAIEQPEHGADDGDHDQQYEDARRAAERRSAAAAPAEAHHDTPEFTRSRRRILVKN